MTIEIPNWLLQPNMPYAVDPPRTIVIDPDEDAEVFGDRCEAQDSHNPLPKYLELHHIIPQSWQKFWQPNDPSMTLVGGLWDPRTVAVCRTAHGNVHYWLVAFMLRWKRLDVPVGTLTNDLLSVDGVVRQVLAGEQYHRREVLFARQGMERWISRGGHISDLLKVPLYGGIYGR